MIDKWKFSILIQKDKLKEPFVNKVCSFKVKKNRNKRFKKKNGKSINSKKKNKNKCNKNKILKKYKKVCQTLI
jgi:hypothetical protein